MSQMNHDEFKSVAEACFAATLFAYKAPAPSGIQMKPVKLADKEVYGLHFKPSTRKVSVQLLREAFSSIQVDGFSLEDMFVSACQLKSISQGRLNFISVTLALVDDEASRDVVLVACTLCGELGSFDCRVV